MVNTPWFPMEVLSYPIISTGKEIEFSYLVMIDSENKFSPGLICRFLYLNFFIGKFFLMCIAFLLS